MLVNRENMRLGIRFEEFCAKLFEEHGFKVERNILIKDDYNAYEIDLSLKDKDKKLYIVEIKAYLSSRVNIADLERAIMQLDKSTERISSSGREYKRVLVVLSPTTEEMRNFVEVKNDVILIDLSNLLYLVSIDESLKTEFYDIIGSTLYFIENLESKPPNLNLDYIKMNNARIFNRSRSNSTSSLITKLKRLNPGWENYKEYEELCESILKHLFQKHLSSWQKQNRTDDDLNRMDLVCRINKGNTFWDFIIESFNSRYLIFEFKNYEGYIKQTQIYTTEKYLYKTALRTVCILISRKGTSENAEQAIKGILRETGKLIVPLSDEDIIEMLIESDSGGKAEDILYSKVDQILLTLSK